MLGIALWFLEEGSPEIYTNLADYFREEGKNGLAGKFYLKAGNYATAFDYLVKNATDPSSLKLALQCAASSKDEHMIAVLLDYLSGKSDGNPKYFRVRSIYFSSIYYLKDSAMLPKCVSDAVKIFTLTAIECWRTDLQLSAYKWATVILRPDYRSQIEENYRNTILTIVRQAD
ncbi:WD repeat-containing protein 19 [Trichuris trichiura]|uniref:WD repeat-containing protein 19 n=1 Tax=Trichuris trichiura TaxID=36087 RepID=A0A077Z939_TRITR|nr:WD repeat-containing protein 19 [Trichuris trichiura]